MQKVILYGLSAEEESIIRDSGLQCEWLVYDVYQDVLAHYAELSIINPDALDEEGLSALSGFFHEIDPIDEKVIMTKNAPEFCDVSFVEIIPDFFEFPDSIPLMIMKNLKETKRDVDFSRRIMYAIKIMRLIEENSGITTKEISNRTELSERSVKRYIRSIQAADVMIEYRNKGWYCDVDPRETV